MRLPETLEKEVRRVADEAERTIAPGGRSLWMRVNDSVWREAIAQHLGARGARVIHVPDGEDADAALAALTQAAEGDVDLLATVFDGATPFEARAAAVADRLLAQQRFVVVVFRGRWGSVAEGDASPTARALDTIVREWSRAEGAASILWVSPQPAAASFRGLRRSEFQREPALSAWSDDEVGEAVQTRLPGNLRCAPASFMVANLLARRGGIGEAAAFLRVMSARLSMLEALSLEAEHLDKLLTFLGPCAALRFPIARPLLASITAGQPTGAIELLWEHGEQVALPSEVGQALGGLGGRATDYQKRQLHGAHDRLAAMHRKLDGERDPRAAGASAFHWMSKVHHLARGSADSVREWSQQHPPTPEFYWDRGRWLSVAERDYEGAAAVYAKCLQRFPSDAYSLHYHAYNLHRAGLDRGTAEDHYRAAIVQDPGNVWFHRRLVVFYIGLARLSQARDAWGAALRAIDEHPGWARDRAWVVENLHLPVASAWLDAGKPLDAREVLGDLDAEELGRSPRMEELSLRIDESVEALELGDSVFPPGTPPASRRKRPEELPLHDERGSTLLEWFPARVVEANAERVAVLFGRYEGDVLVLYDQEFVAEEWRTYAQMPPEDASGYCSIGRYASGKVRIVARSTPSTSKLRPFDAPYLDRWLRS